MKYAILINKTFVKDWDPITGTFEFADDIHRALLYTPKGIEPHLDFFERHNAELVKVEDLRVITSTAFSAQSLLDECLDECQRELESLEAKNVENLTDKEYRRYKRLQRQIADRVIDHSAY